MATIGEWRRQQAERFAKETQALVNVLRRRMEWHQDRLQKATDPFEQEWHDELILRDIESLDEAKKQHENRRDHYKATGVGMPDVSFE
jgi:hypothetical protein